MPVTKSAPLTPQPPMHRTHRRRTPLTAAEIEAARADERERQKWDPEYITAEEARAIPPDLLRERIDLQRRIRYSQPDWPENRMSASEALGPLPAGGGERDLARGVDASELFWSPERGGDEGA